MGTAKVFESPLGPEPSPALGRAFPMLTKQAVRELVKSFDEFLQKSRAVKSDLHWELWKYPDDPVQHLTVSALAADPDSPTTRHVIKFEFVGDPTKGEDEKYLLHLLADLEAEFGVKITPGKWY
jgi:hypothetical protein